MRIPTYEPQQVAPQAAQAPAHQVAQVGGFDALAKAGDEAGQAVAEGYGAYEKQQHEMQVKAALDGHTELTSTVTNVAYGSTTTPSATGPTPDVTKMSDDDFGKLLDGPSPQTTPGYLSVRGEAAVPALDPAIDSIAKKRADIAAKMTDKKAREMFLRGTDELMSSTYQKFKAHAAEQIEVAKTDTVKANLASGLRVVSANPADDVAANQAVATTVAGAVALATSPADAKAKEEAIRSEVASARIDSLIAPDENGRVPKEQVDKAQSILEQHRPVLGERLKPLETRIAAAAKAAGKQDLEDVAEGVATDIVNLAKDPISGKVDEAKVWEMVGTAHNRAEKDELRKRVQSQLTEQAAVFTRTTDEVLAHGMAAHNLAGSVANMPAALKQKLNDWPDKGGPDLLNTLMGEDDRKKRQAKTSRSEAIKDQTAYIKEAQEWFKGLPIEEQATMDLGPSGPLAQRYPGLLTKMKGVPDGLTGLAPTQRIANDHVTKGQSTTVNRVIQDTVDALSGGEGAYISPGANPEERVEHARRLAEVKAQTLDAYNQYVEDHHGKAPSKTEAAKISSDIVLAQPIDPTSAEQLRANANAASVRVGGARVKKLEAQPASPEWTDADKAAAVKRLRAAGAPVNDDTIEASMRHARGLNTAPTREPAPPPSPTDAVPIEDIAPDGEDTGD